jgi:hypothetical protein
LGAIGDIALAIKRANIDDDLMIVGGDTLYYDDLSLRDVVTAFAGT